MPLPSADRALRRLVVDLAELHADDMAAILDLLDADQRRRVEVLVHAYAGADADQDNRTGSSSYDGSVFSPWLMQRLESGEGMTSQAYGALRTCAAKLHPASGAVLAGGDQAQPSLIARFMSAFPIGVRAA